MKLAERANAGIHLHVIERIQRAFADKDAAILDIGCGNGSLLSRLSKLGYRNLWGVDIALPASAVEGVTFSEHDLDSSAIPFTNATFDLIVSVEVFEHIENMGTLLREISRLLTPTGSLLVTTPNVHSLEARVRYFLLGKLKQFDELSDPTHLYPVFLYTFNRILRRHSLLVIETWGYPTDGSSPTSRRLLKGITWLLWLFGLRAIPSGDHLCLLIRRETPIALDSKRVLVTSHYPDS